MVSIAQLDVQAGERGMFGLQAKGLGGIVFQNTFPDRGPV
jgi:hypothetical protein